MTKLLSPRFDRYVSRERRDSLLLRLAPLMEIIEVVQRVQACRHPRDDKFLDAAVNGSADVLVSGDKDLQRGDQRCKTAHQTSWSAGLPKSSEPHPTRIVLSPPG